MTALVVELEPHVECRIGEPLALRVWATDDAGGRARGVGFVRLTEAELRLLVYQTIDGDEDSRWPRACGAVEDLVLARPGEARLVIQLHPPLTHPFEPLLRTP